MNQCICDHPVIIINPLAKELISQHANYTIRGKKTVLYRTKNILYDFKTKNINPFSLHIGHNDIDSCFITNRNSQERYPLYIEVPCGNCEVCKSSKVNAFVHRCKLETMAYDCKPLFLTLTYDEQHVKECGVCLRDIQLFFKRLRIRLYRAGIRQKIRYVVCAEYGKRTLRPHYHALLWNLQQQDIPSYLSVRDLIEKSWSNGFIMLRQVDPSNDKAFYYTSKYLRKDCVVPERKNATFMVSSNRGGGIGSPFLDSIANEVQRTCNTKFKFLNKWNNKTEDLQYNRYILNRIFPSLCRSLPPKLKTSVREFLLGYQILKSRNNENTQMFYENFQKFEHFFGQYFYCPVLEPSEIKASMEDVDSKILRKMLEAEAVIERSFSLGRTKFESAVVLNERRQKFLELLFKNQHYVDVRHKGYLARRSAALASEREIF